MQLEVKCYALCQTTYGSISREVKLIQKNLKQLQAESDKRDSKLYMNMFAHMTRDTPLATKVSDVSLILLASNDHKVGKYYAMFGFHPEVPFLLLEAGNLGGKQMCLVMELECVSPVVNGYA